MTEMRPFAPVVTVVFDATLLAMRLTTWLLSAVSLLLVGTACGQPRLPAATSPKPPAASTVTPAAGTVRVYFVRADKVATAGRQVADPSAKDQAVQALLSGPSDFERSIGMSTDIPSASRLLGLKVIDGTATVDLSNDFQSGQAAQRIQPRVAEIVFTLTQFQDVRQVTITLEGKPVEGGVDLKRGDLETLTPKILVESPVPGQSVTSPLKVSGAANVFEGTLSYSVDAAEGAELDHGFTTATQQEWSNWYAFTFTSAYPAQQRGLGHVVVWETSMKDGSRLNVYDVPVNM